VPELRGGVWYQEVEEPLQVQRHRPPIPATERMFAPAFRRVHEEMWQVLRPCLLLGLHQPQVGDSVRARAAAPRVALVLFPERKIASTIFMVFWALVMLSSSGNSGTTMKCR
jgi:hypothetical protein